MNFDIGQRVRIVGPTVFGAEIYLGKCFVIGVIDEVPDWEVGTRVYSKKDCRHEWPPSSLELAEPESDSTNPTLAGHPIEEVKRTPPEEFQNIDGARLDLSGEFAALRSVKLCGALDGCGISAELENKLNKLSPEDERMHRWAGKLVVTVSEIDRITRELGAIQTAIGVLKQREQDLLEKRDKLMEAT